MSKLPWKRADDASTGDPDTESILLDDAFDSFTSERSSVRRAMEGVRTAVTDALLSVGSFRSISARNYLLVGTASIACVLLGLLVVGRMLGGSQTEQAIPSVSANSLPDASTNPAEHAASSKDASGVHGSSAAQRLTRAATRGGAPAERQRSSANSGVPITPRIVPRERTSLQPQPAAVAPVPVPDAAAIEQPTVTDMTVYSEADRDVRPPVVLSSELPGPTFSQWTTRTNVMELIISETGAVERARLLAAPQRMPDMMLLSRAKLWTFGPAMKDGHPVRYRLVLKWEVNP